MVLVIQRLPIIKELIIKKNTSKKNNLVNIKQNFDDTRLNNEFTNNETNQNRKKIITKKSPITCYRCGQQGHYYKHCPYSFKQLAEFENQNQGSSNDHLNF
jgi:hypothetical protein